jgi:hypothetical protein
MRTALIATTTVLVAIGVLLFTTLPLPPRVAEGSVDPALAKRTLAGAFHVHSSRSDGASSKAQIAAAASRAGLRFVVFTEHGNGTEPLDRPEYIGDVLCLDAVEISTTGGHYVALGLERAPYPLRGEPAAVVEDVRRLGGFGVVAHPDSAKPALAWSQWDLPVDGLEWLNADSEWRNEGRVRLLRTLFDYLLRPGPALGGLFDRPAGTLATWDALTAERCVVGVAGHDAHGGVTRAQEGRTRLGISGVPSYEATFRSFALRVITQIPLTGDGATDGRLLMEALRDGRVFTAIDALAAPALLEFNGRRGGMRAEMGEQATGEGPLELTARATIPQGGELVLLRNGIEIARSRSAELSLQARESGSYRVEVHVPRAPGTPPIPWIVSNPIYAIQATLRSGLSSRVEDVTNLMTPEWRTETDARSAATISSGDGGIRLEYRLAGGEAAHQFAALVRPMPRGLPSFDGIALTLQANAPSRISLQLRLDSGGERWIRSVYVSPDISRVVVPLKEFVAANPSTSRPDLRSATSLMLVVDTTHHNPGEAGMFALSEAAVVRLRP